MVFDSLDKESWYGSFSSIAMVFNSFSHEIKWILSLKLANLAV
jgi:hypothetical protein